MLSGSLCPQTSSLLPLDAGSAPIDAPLASDVPWQVTRSAQHWSTHAKRLLVAFLYLLPSLAAL